MFVLNVLSGGYNIKTGPGCSIEIMKIDMGGSAAVLGAAKALGQIKPPGVEVSHWVALIFLLLLSTSLSLCILFKFIF